MKLLWVMIGGSFGALCRFALGEWTQAYNGFPLGTFITNLLGCLFLGWFLTYVSQHKNIKPEITLLLGTGFIGSFTTFSTFSVETIYYLQHGLVFMAIFYVLASTGFGIVFAYAGYRLANFSKKRSVVR